MATTPIQQLPSYLSNCLPFQQAMAETGCLSSRLASREFKMIFDRGLSLAWEDLKRKAAQLNCTIMRFMTQIEAAEERPNSLRYFQLLKREVHQSWGRYLLFIDPAVDLPTDISFIGLLGLEYKRDQIPEKVKECAFAISRLKMDFCLLVNPPPIPKIFCDLSTKEIMAFPIFDPSHPEFKSALENELVSSDKMPQKEIDPLKLCHVREQATYEGEQQRRLFSRKACVLCQHEMDEKSLLIANVLQEEILHFLEKSLKKGQDIQEKSPLQEMKKRKPMNLAERLAVYVFSKLFPNFGAATP